MACHDVEVPPEMTAALAAYADFRSFVEQGEALERTRRRARLGRAVLEERTRLGKTQDEAATELKVVVEQIRRYEATWRAWQRDHPDVEP